jgi:hypothetical protein
MVNYLIMEAIGIRQKRFDENLVSPAQTKKALSVKEKIRPVTLEELKALIKREESRYDWEKDIFNLG